MTKTVYVPVSINDELPEIGKSNLIIQATHELSNVNDFQLREATFTSSFMDNSSPYFNVGKRYGEKLFVLDKVTHWLKETEAILLTPEEAEKIKFVLDILTQPVFQKDYPEYSKLATESLKIFDK